MSFDDVFSRRNTIEPEAVRNPKYRIGYEENGALKETEYTCTSSQNAHDELNDFWEGFCDEKGLSLECIDEIISAGEDMNRVPHERETIIRAMEEAGYTYDENASGPDVVFNYEGGTARFNSWIGTDEWIRGVVFDDPVISEKTENVLRHQERSQEARRRQNKEIHKDETPEQRKARQERNLRFRMQENRKATSLTSSQHDALEFLCKVRHDMHKGQNAFFFSEDPRYSQFETFLGKDGQGTINQILKEAGLPEISVDTDIFKVDTAECFKREDFRSDYEYEMTRAKAYDHSKALAEQINGKIEAYLGEIDRQHGTNYKPYGDLRETRWTKEHIVQHKFEKKEKKSGEKPRVFIDMDGTLAKFNPVSTLEDLLEPGYFQHLEPNLNVVDAVRELIERGDVEVYTLSAVLTDSLTAHDEKNRWLDAYLPEIKDDHRIFLPCGDNKLHYIPDGVRATDILLDDYTKNLSQWQPPAVGIKLMNDINHTHGSWEGDRISYARGGHDIAERIEKIAMGKGHTYDQNRISERNLAEIYFGEIRKGTVPEIIVRLDNMASTLGAFPRTQEEIKRLFADFQIGVEKENGSSVAMVRGPEGGWEKLSEEYPSYDAVKGMVESVIGSASTIFMEEAKERREGVNKALEPERAREEPEIQPEPEPEQEQDISEPDNTWSFGDI